jgi:hypothetical protein
MLLSGGDVLSDEAKRTILAAELERRDPSVARWIARLAKKGPADRFGIYGGRAVDRRADRRPLPHLPNDDPAIDKAMP